MFRYALTIVLVPSTLYAQHPTHPMPQQAPMKPMAMMMIDPLGVSMERMGSGTTWIPDAVPLPARHRMVGSWLVMLHGFGFVQYDKQAARRRSVRLAQLGDAHGKPGSAGGSVSGENDVESRPRDGHEPRLPAAAAKRRDLPRPA